MSLKTDFEKASRDVMNLPDRPGNDVLLSLYALFKQASEGDVSGPKPGLFDLKGKAKYEAWSKKKGTPKEKAMEQYVALVKKLQGKK